MHDDLTREDIKKMQEELDYRRLKLHPEILEEVKRTRAFGDLSENYEYKAAKQAQQVLGKRVGDRFTVQVNETYSYEAVIRSITKDSDDGSVPLLGY